MNVVRFSEAKAYHPPGHVDMRCLRLQGKEAGPSDGMIINLCQLLPGGETGADASTVEKMYVVLEGEVRISNGEVEVTLGPYDSVRIAAGESRLVTNKTNRPATVLLSMLDPARGRIKLMSHDLQRTMSRLTMRHLRIVLAIIDGGSLVVAAQRLCMTQPAITKALQETEALLGVDLFSRTNRGVLPTEFGLALAAHARLITAQVHHAAEEIHDLREGMGGRVVVGTLLAASADLLPRAIAALRRERPKLVVSIVEGSHDRLLPDLRVGKLDLLVGRLPEHHEREGLHQETLLMDASVVVVRPGHPLTMRPDLHLADLLSWDWILPRPETTLRRHIDEAFREDGVEPPAHAVESVSQLTSRSLVMEADYLAVWPWLVARGEAAAGNIAILPVLLKTTVGPIGISTRADMRLPSAAEMLRGSLRVVAEALETCPLLGDIAAGDIQPSG